MHTFWYFISFDMNEEKNGIKTGKSEEEGE